MQPPPRRNRQIVRDLRPDRPLVYERLSDPILVRRVKDGDQLALAALCARHADRVHRIALHVLRDPEDANDAAQESMVKLVRRVKQFRGDSQFSTWLHRLVVNTCKDVAQARWAAERRTEPLLEDTRVARDGDPARALAAAETQTRARRAASPSCPPPRRASSRSRTRSTCRSTRSRRRRGCLSERRSATRTEGARRSGRSSPHERAVAGQGGHRGCAAASRPDAPDRRGARARARESVSSPGRRSRRRTARATFPATRSCPA